MSGQRGGLLRGIQGIRRDGAAFQTFRADAYAKAASSVIDKYKPDVVLYRATSQGADLSTACAAALETGLASDAIGLEIDADKTVKVLRAAFGGNFLVSVANKKMKPQMATVRPKVFPCRNETRRRAPKW